MGDSNGNYFKGQICTNGICACKSMQSYKLKVILGLYRAQRIVSKLSEKKKKKITATHPSELFSSQLRSQTVLGTLHPGLLLPM